MTRVADVEALERLRSRIESTTNATMAAAGIDSHLVRCDVEGDSRAVVVKLDLPVAISPIVKRAIAVRVLDAVRSTGCTYGEVDVRITTRAA